MDRLIEAATWLVWLEVIGGILGLVLMALFLPWFIRDWRRKNNEFEARKRQWEQKRKRRP